MNLCYGKVAIRRSCVFSNVQHAYTACNAKLTCFGGSIARRSKWTQLKPRPCSNCSQRRSRLVCRASGEEPTSSPSSSLAASPLLQGVVAVFVLGLVDAAYSGDWSRIGAISKETEELLQQVVVALGVVNVGCAAGSAVLLSRRGKQDWLLTAGKALLIGPLALLEAIAA